MTAKLQTTFESYADDVNGDGHVLVQINVYTISYAAKRAAQSGSAAASAASAASGADSSGSEMGEEFLSAGTDAYAQMAGDIQLSADLESSDTGIFILYDPAGFESYTSALRYLNGTSSETSADGYGGDWYNMVYRWTDCPTCLKVPASTARWAITASASAASGRTPRRRRWPATSALVQGHGGRRFDGDRAGHLQDTPAQSGAAQ